LCIISIVFIEYNTPVAEFCIGLQLLLCLVDTTISEVDEVVGFADPVETVKKLKVAATANKMAYVFTDIKYANLYHEALKKEKRFSMPNSAVVSELHSLLII